MIQLAETLDMWTRVGRAYVVEAESTATVSGLNATDAAELVACCQALSWAVDVFDSADNAWLLDDLPDLDFAPYRVRIHKPPAPPDTLQLLTNHAFAWWLLRGHAAPHWDVAGLTGSIVTQSRVMRPWGTAETIVAAPPGKNPRMLVRELSANRRVPDDARPWLATPLEPALFATPTAQIWVHAATGALILSLPDEIDPTDGSLKFRGPPRLSLPAITDAEVAPNLAGFNALQAAARWVFENEREAEMRHILLATELARSGAAAAGTVLFLQDHLNNAWESAQIAYQMALADASRDTLKVLSDLRKAITDETAKLSDLSRQLAASVAAALATGIGLIAARATADAPKPLIAAVMSVVVVYVLTVIVSGIQFIGVQRQLRADWQPRLYRFLPSEEYARMVAKPAARAEAGFRWTAILGGSAVLALALVCFWFIRRPANTTTARPSAAEFHAVQPRKEQPAAKPSPADPTKAGPHR
ncbi:hypothetical protein [Xanthomonas arboricola]|uniref:hypothetical protein n=1 Tax=Xanthomonas arboricola TaxID=56448 RepID=UPI000CEE2C8D|nr:hypothetical protein [Xanthomonas arboricola]PPT30110.1 hypothetical protein XarbCFBP7614_00550 [Xanthomonas arboricola]